MDSQRWQKIQDVFSEALVRDPQARSSFLEDACGGDRALHDQVGALIAASHQADGAFEQAIRGTLELAAEEHEDDEERREIGPYRLIRELGRGGQSSVYLAERADEEFRMRVALKLVRRGLDTQDILRRLRQERQILANLRHPNIARLLDGGTTEDGLPYFVMELIDGEHIDLYCDHRELSIPQRLELFRQVCSAVQSAHRNLVIHRDLKPSNILVNEDGVPKLLDFGIAKLLGTDVSTRTLARTRPEARLLTPEYASPEQIRGEPLTTATDVYSLGVLLYLLLSGRSPYSPRLDRPGELERMVCEVEPPRPSAAVISATRGGRAEKRRRRLAGDLDNIVLKALRKEPERRYGSVEQLSEDLRRHLVGLPVAARPDALGYRLRKFAARHRAGLATTAAVLALVVSLVAFYTARLRHERDLAREAQEHARSSAAEARQVSDFLRELLENADPGRSKGEDVTVREVLEQGAARIEGLADQPELRSSLMGLMGTVYQRLGQNEKARPLLKASLAIRQQLFGDENVETARAKIALEELLYETGEHDEARKLVEEALATQRRLLAEDHEDIAVSLNNLAALHHAQGDLESAESLLRKSWDMWRRLHEEESQKAVSSLNNLAVTLHDRGELEQAEQLYREARELKRKVFGEEHPDTAAAIFNLAVLHVDRGDPAAAVELSRQALDLRHRLLGEDHPHAYRTAHFLAVALDSNGDLDAAEELFRQTLVKHQQTEPDSPRTARLLHDLGDLLVRREDFGSAEGFLRRALEIRRQAVPQDRCLTAEAEALLGACLSRGRRSREAETLLLASYSTLKECDRIDPRARLALRPLAEIYETRADQVKAEEIRDLLDEPP